MKKIPYTLAALILILSSLHFHAAERPDTVAVFIILGQSNADGSAFSDPAIDGEMKQWWYSSPQSSDLHIWYRPTVVRNEKNTLGQMARHVYDGRYRDMPPGWMQLWYRNDNTASRTAMNMIHGAGSYSAMAQGRRGIEGEFGRRFAMQYPGRELYVIKLGVSGSGIDTWANEADDHNWHYFTDNIFNPAIQSLRNIGKIPALAGIWWMQGCADSESDAETYYTKLSTLTSRLRSGLQFPDATIYIGLIPAPGEDTVTPEGSCGYGAGVREAQMRLASEQPNTVIIPTADCPMQYEENFHGYIHFNHQGINRIADRLMDSIAARGISAWPVGAY